MKIKNTLLIFLSWRIWLFLISAAAIYFLPIFGNRFPYNDVVLKTSGLPQWLYQFGNFDGVHYVGIAQSGYARQFTQAFFPLYPMLIKIMAPIFLRNFVLAGIVVSSIFTFLAAWMLSKLIDRHKDNRKWIILFFLFFPMSFFMGAIYNESLFIFLVFSCFYFARRKNWWLVGILGALASATRLVGIFLLPALVYEYICVGVSHGKPLRKIIYLLLIPLGVLAYMVYLQINFGDALYFLHAQSAFGASRSTGIVFPLITIWRYIKIFATVPFIKYDFWVAVWEAGFFLVGLLLLTAATIKKYKISYLIFSWACFLLPIFTGTLSSFPRYLLVCFPICIFLGNISSKSIKIFLLSIFLILNSLFLILFTRGYWVS